MKTSLVTGGAGFIGSHVTDSLIDKGHKVVVLDDLSGGFQENVNPKAEFVQGSVTDSDFVEELFKRHQFDYVYHLAAYAAEGLSHFIRKFNYENNLIGSINLINSSVRHNVKHFVFTSSIAVYGSNQIPMLETMRPDPEDPYGISKFAVELDLAAAHKMFGLNFTIFRPHNVYGIRQNHGDPYRNVIGIFINNLLQGKKMTVFGDGKQTRAFTHISDVAPYIAAAPEVAGAKNEIFNIGADHPYTVLQLVDTIASAMGVSPDMVEFLPARKEVVHAVSDHKKVREAFHIGEPVALEQGIKEMVAWAKKKAPCRAKNLAILKWRKICHRVG